MRALGALISVLVASLLFAETAAAQPRPERLFTVTGIAVDVTATTAANARRQGLAEAQEEAYERLVDKLVDADDAALLPPPSQPLIERLVRSVDISNERSSSTRYLATIDVAFHPGPVRELFAEYGVAYTESSGGPYLLLPLYLHGGRLHLLDAHPWRRALEEGDLANRLIAYRFPEAGLRARVRLAAHRIARATSPDLASLAEDFEVPRVVIARAETGRDDATGRRIVRYRVFGGPGEIPEAVDGLLIAARDEDLPELLARAADAVLDAVDVDWKSRTLVAGREISRLSVLAPVRDLADWLAVRERLATVSLVRRVGVERVGLPLSAFSLSYVGSMEQFRLALAQARLVLEDAGGRYVLRPVEQARAAELPATEDGGEGA